MSPELSGALAGLEVLDLSHLPRFKRAVDAGRQVGFGYYLPHLLSQNRRGRSVLLLGEDEGSICIYRWRRQGTRVQLDLATAPTPLVPQVLSRCLERANDYNKDRSARVLRIDAQDVAAASELPHLRIRQRKSQYLYAPKDFRDLAGRRYRTLRRNVVSVQKLAGLEVVPYLG